MRIMLITAAAAVFATGAFAAVQTETVTYEAGDTTLQGYLAYDDAVEGQRPGVIVVHEWTGLGEHPKDSAEKLAEMGYVGFAVDMYGEGKTTEDTEQAMAWSGEIKENPELAHARFTAALETLRDHERVNGDSIAAIGYCFGGTVVLEMARSGLDLDGVVSFHGGLKSAIPEDERDIKAKVLVLHGADDPHVPMDEVQAFWKEMQEAGVDWYLIAYGNAVHSFTNPNADRETAKYDEKAAKRSWEAMRDFLQELFANE